MTKIIGLTGGIGSGKTTIAKYIESQGIPVYIADVEAKKISESKKVVSKIINLFGDEIVDGYTINKQKLATIVFNDEEKLKLLNNIIHPEVKKHFLKWFKQHNKHPFVIKEAAILFESGSYKDCDFIISVIAPLKDRIQRVALRDNSNEEKVLERVRNQWTDEQRIKHSDFIITNEKFEDTKIQIQNILKELRKVQ